MADVGFIYSILAALGWFLILIALLICACCIVAKIGVSRNATGCCCFGLIFSIGALTFSGLSLKLNEEVNMKHNEMMAKQDENKIKVYNTTVDLRCSANLSDSLVNEYIPSLLEVLNVSSVQVQTNITNATHALNEAVKELNAAFKNLNFLRGNSSKANYTTQKPNSNANNLGYFHKEDNSQQSLNTKNNTFTQGILDTITDTLPDYFNNFTSGVESSMADVFTSFNIPEDVRNTTTYSVIILVIVFYVLLILSFTCCRGQVSLLAFIPLIALFVVLTVHSMIGVMVVTNANETCPAPDLRFIDECVDSHSPLGKILNTINDSLEVAKEEITLIAKLAYNSHLYDNKTLTPVLNDVSGNIDVLNYLFNQSSEEMKMVFRSCQCSNLIVYDALNSWMEGEYLDLMFTLGVYVLICAVLSFLTLFTGGDGLNCLGFDSEGVRASSFASFWQSRIGDVPRGSGFSRLQSYGARR